MTNKPSYNYGTSAPLDLHEEEDPSLKIKIKSLMLIDCRTDCT